jgi:hypothetical protein
LEPKMLATKATDENENAIRGTGMLRKVLCGVITAVAMTAAGSLQAATFGTYGDTFSNGTNFDLTSYGSSGAGYSGLYIIPGGALTLSGITQLSADYNMLAGSFAGGAPRFGIADTNAGPNNQVWAYWGTPTGGGTFVNPNSNGTPGNTGNYADLLSTDIRFYSNGFGGFNSPNIGVTWADLLSHVGSVTVAYILLDLDGGWKGDQHLLVNNFTVNGDVLATPLPAALPLFATGLGAMGLLGWRRNRKAKAVAD